jgi:demethylmenaquinone methyltransferase/2-methoxy-6-polyprenyl-1,4-benzoquinol methylase
MFDRIAPRYDVVNRVLTFRMDVGWRSQALDALYLTKPSKVIDLAAGTGDLSRDLERCGHIPIAVDLSFGMLAHARTAAPLVQADALAMPIASGSVDGVVCGFALRNFVELDGVFDELFRVLRPGGRISLLDVSAPDNAVLRTGHRFYFGKVVPLVGGLLSDRSAYQYLPKSVAYMPPTEELLEKIRQYGFIDVRRRQLSGGIAQLITGTRGTLQ